MNDKQAGGILLALCIAGAFFAWAFADWIDGETATWERDVAERHAKVYADVRCER